MPSTMLRPTLRATVRTPCIHCETQQIRHASLLRRPKRPYTFTQLITLSDGSTFTHRTTSPQSIYKCTKDTKNHILWNPSSQKLRNVEADEAGRLRKFRARFGRGFDVEAVASEEEPGEGEEGVSAKRQDESLLDLIQNYRQGAEDEGDAAGTREGKAKSGKGKGGEK